jgi:hypothetical protein
LTSRATDRAARRAGEWPDGKRFAFTIFDDSDDESMANGPAVCDLLDAPIPFPRPECDGLVRPDRTTPECRV